jgi:hypothetical protein
VLQHLPLVKAIAVRVYENLPVHVELDDLIHAGIIVQSVSGIRVSTTGVGSTWEMSTAMLLGCGLLVKAGLASFGKLLALNKMQRK